MNLKTLSFIIVPVIAFPGIILADPTPPEIIKHPKSRCLIEKSGGEYPSYVVKSGNNVVYSPKSDGIINALFSPTGEYIAFSGSEINGVDIGEEYFSVVILKCDSGIIKGFMKGFPSGDESIGMSWVNDETLKYFDTSSEKEILLEISPKTNGSFQISEKVASNE